MFEHVFQIDSEIVDRPIIKIGVGHSEGVFLTL